MAMLRFEDVATRVNTREDRFNTALTYYVGGEHIETGELKVAGCGVIKEADLGPMFYFGFKPGDILFVTRNPHLRKCAMVDFPGICSEKTLVIATKDESVLSQRYLAAVMQSDDFWEFMEENKSGSVNYFVNWSTLAEYEFDLPPIDRQRELADLLWAANDLKEAYKKGISATDEMLKAKFREMFENEKWPKARFEDVAPSRLGKMLDARKQTGRWARPYLANVNVQWFRFDLNDLRQMDFDEEEQIEFRLRDGDLLVCEGGEVGRCAIWHNEIQECYFQKAIHRVRCNRNILMPEYVAWWFRRKAERGEFATKGTTIAHLPGDKLKELQIAIPPMDEQCVFVTFAKKADTLRASLTKAITDLEQVMKGLING